MEKKYFRYKVKLITGIWTISTNVYATDAYDARKMGIAKIGSMLTEPINQNIITVKKKKDGK